MDKNVNNFGMLLYVIEENKYIKGMPENISYPASKIIKHFPKNGRPLTYSHGFLYVKILQIIFTDRG